LHSKVSDIISLALDKNNENVVNHFLYQTSLIRKILDTSRDGGVYTFQSTNLTVNKGFMAFMRKLSNKLVDLQKKNDEVSNFLESIPEWAEFHDNVLTTINAIESKPLASDPRKHDTSNSDDYFDLIYKLKDVHRSGFQNKGKKNTESQDDNDDDNDDNEDNDNNDEEDDSDKTKDLYSHNDGITNKKSRNKRIGYQEQNEDEDDDEFERLMNKDEDEDNNDSNG
jgi:hypothetical protein